VSAYEAYEIAGRTFQRDKWFILADPTTRLPIAEYREMDAGPDLTVLRRRRYGRTRAKRRATAFNLFIREAFVEHREDWKDVPRLRKFAMCSELWSGMDDAEKAGFKQRATE